MGKTRDLFKNMRAFHAEMGTIKDRTGMDLTEAEDVQKRWQEYTEELYKKDLHDPDNHDDVITHLGPVILECEVKWTLGSITTNKTSGGSTFTASSLGFEIAQLEVHHLPLALFMVMLPKVHLTSHSRMSGSR